MPVKLPRRLVGAMFAELFSIEMNNFDVEMLLPALFWLVRSGGKDRAKTQADAANIVRSVETLAEHKKLDGFLYEEGKRLLDKWVRCSLIQTSLVGRKKTAEQITYVRPLSFLCYKPSLPKHVSRLRQSHHFVYSLLNGYLTCDSQDHGTMAQCFDKLVQETFAKGLDLENGVNKDGKYDGHSNLDLEVLLQLYYLDGFDAPQENRRAGKSVPSPACPLPAKNFAQDVAGFLTVYSRRVPTASLSKYLIALLNFELLMYTLRLMRATNQLVLHNSAEPEFSQNPEALSSLDLYVDLTQVPGSRSNQLAGACVNRDLEEMQNFFRSKLMLRTLDIYAKENDDIKPQLEHKTGGEYITTLWSLCDREDVQADARRDLQEVRKLLCGDDNDYANVPADIRAVLDRPAVTGLFKLVEILVLEQRHQGINNMAKWIADVGGLKREDGILRGNTKGRRLWRYVMSDTLLETLVQLAVINPEAQSHSGELVPKAAPRSITLSAFLTFLKSRFGIVIGAPPSFDSSSEAIEAAKMNLEALRQRLRQMGLFMDLSDDFNAQRISPRFMKETSEMTDPSLPSIRPNSASAHGAVRTEEHNSQ